jgi:SAM-dependent methyltransferase
VTAAEHYTAEFFNRQQEGSFQSALRILPLVFDLTAPRSVIDVGCGVGTWLAAARTLGVVDVMGLDGEYVDRRLLRIPPDCFRATDLSRPVDCERTFDLALSLEVAEHLPETSASALVESLTRLAPAVLFSAAIPEQCGAHHVNLQWQSWWVEQFNRREFEAVDCIRQRVWNDADVEWWYAQNMFLMVRRDRLESSPHLKRELAQSTWPHGIVHPRGYLERVAVAEAGVPAGIRDWLALGPRVTRATASRLWRRLSGRGVSS